MGKYRQFIVPPNCVRLKLVGIKGRRHFIVESVKEPSIPHWKPLIVMTNRKSGNGDGEMILQAFRRILNPAQVCVIHHIVLLSGICIGGISVPCSQPITT
jgi:diacylglycerol kinase (ATP)